ncbi:hypothetical protein [Mesoplasma melaleucae]|uniref:hypothetical protein n=1 Tax=Mesoplasma melaleucae TaxID=81459 RepID=UPI0012EC5B3F|nr:hypothetical protein [Mesoplasma melaleucae]
MKKQKNINNGLSTEIEENISLDNNYKILHRKLKIEFWVFFGITILCWTIMIILGISSGFFSSINDQSGPQKELSTFLCSKIF